MEVLITDLTEMSSSRICVAGWSLADNKMVRPLLKHPAHWSVDKIKTNEIKIGSLIKFQINDPQPNSRPYPHKTEDVEVTHEFFKIEDRAEDKVHQMLSSNLMENPKIYFNLKSENKYTLPNSGLFPSLGGIRICSTDLKFWEKNSNPPKLRAQFNILTEKFDFPVKSIRLKKLWNQLKIDELNKKFHQFKYLHLRLGLANAWVPSGVTEKRCYCQLNEILFTEAL